MILANKRIANDESIRPVVYGVGLYFLLAGLDCFNIGSVGSMLKLVSFIPLFLVFLDLRKLQIRFSAVLVFQLLLWLLTIVSLFYSISVTKTSTLIKTLTLNLILVFALGAMEQYNQRELQFMQDALFAGGWIVIILMLLLSDVSKDGRLILALGGKTSDPNYINGYFLYTFSYHCNRMLQQDKKIHIIPMIFILAVVLLTGSRGALVAFTIALFAHLCVNFSRTKHTIRNVVLTALIIVVLFGAFDLILEWMPENVAQRFSWDFIAEHGTTGRTGIWQFFLQHFSEDSILRMLFGHGYGTAVLVNTVRHSGAHNLYIEDLINLGVVGLLLELATQVSVLRVFIKYRQYSLLGAYFGMIGMCLSLGLTNYKPIWNITMLALATDFYEKSTHRSTTSF